MCRRKILVSPEWHAIVLIYCNVQSLNKNSYIFYTNFMFCFIRYVFYASLDRINCVMYSTSVNEAAKVSCIPRGHAFIIAIKYFEGTVNIHV